jgi:hypothetical protein
MATDEPARHEQGRARDSALARRYGAHVWHLLVLLALAAVTAYTASRLLGNPQLWRIALWFLGAALVWDLLLSPAYAAVDAVLRRTAGRVQASGVRPLNYVRVPLVLASVLLLVFAPLVLRRSEGVYVARVGLEQDVYLGRYLVLVAVLLLGSAVAFAVAVLRARR